MNSLKPILALAGALTLAACNGTGVIVYEPVDQQGYLDGDLDYAARTGELRVAVVGTPVTNPPENFNENVAIAMRGANRGDFVRFTTRPKETDPDNHRVVMIFNRGINLADDEICGETPAASVAPEVGARTSLVAGFCIGPYLLSTSAGTGPVVQGSDDPQLRKLIRDTVLALIPNEDRKDIGGDQRI